MTSHRVCAGLLTVLGVIVTLATARAAQESRISSSYLITNTTSVSGVISASPRR